MKATANEGFPFPLDTDGSDLPSEAQAFLLAQDGRFAGWDAGFGLIAKPPCFSARTTVNGSPISTSGISTLTWDAVDYAVGVNGVGPGLGAGGSSWNQPRGDGASWWMFGCTILFANVAGSINTNNIVQGNINITDTDPNSPSGATLQFYNQGKGEVTDSNVGQAIQIVTLAHFRNDHAGSAYVAFTYRDTGAGVTKRYQAGSRFWGFRVGSG